MAASGATVEQLAVAAAKNHANGAGNPALLGKLPVTPLGVLRSRVVAWPLTDLMVAPQGAGAAAVVLVGGAARRHLGGRKPRVMASVLVSEADGADGAGARAAGLAYHLAGIGPHEVDCAEVHDETAAAELSAYEELQLVPSGEGPELLERASRRSEACCRSTPAAACSRSASSTAPRPWRRSTSWSCSFAGGAARGRSPGRARAWR
jgi:acetyl-CoA acetyltransferase